MIADEITILEESVKLALAVSIVDSIDVDALEGFEDRDTVVGLKDRLRHILQTIQDAIRESRETIRRSSVNWRPFTPELKNAAKDAERMQLAYTLVNELSDLTTYGQAAELWLQSGAKGKSPSPPPALLYLCSLMDHARKTTNESYRREIANYEKANEQAKETRTRRATT